jgi:hypothetical protein
MRRIIPGVCIFCLLSSTALANSVKQEWIPRQKSFYVYVGEGYQLKAVVDNIAITIAANTERVITYYLQKEMSVVKCFEYSPSARETVFHEQTVPNPQSSPNCWELTEPYAAQ